MKIAKVLEFILWLVVGVCAGVVAAQVADAQDTHPEENYRRMPAPNPIPWIVDYRHDGKCLALIISHEPSFGPTSPEGPKQITWTRWATEGKIDSIHIGLYFSDPNNLQRTMIRPYQPGQWPVLPDGVVRIHVTLWEDRRGGDRFVCAENFDVGGRK